MSNFAYLFVLFSFNSITLISLILISINKKSPRVLLKYLFFPALLTLILGAFIQLQFEISDISLRQLFSNLIVIAWCLKSFNAYNSIKSLLLQEFLESIRDLIHQKKFLIILINTIKISFIQIACFSSVLSLNYLSGYSSLNFLDILGISFCALGIAIELICEIKIKKTKQDENKLIRTGLWSYLRHPNLAGLLLFFFGLQLIALNGIGSQWSVMGFVILLLIVLKKLIPLLERQLLAKYPEYQEYRDTTPVLPTLLRR